MKPTIPSEKFKTNEPITIHSPLSSPADLDPLIQLIGDSKYVLLGEASHGTHEYYIWRTAISKRLIEEKGFSFIAVEGDWPDCYQVNRFVKNYPDVPAKVTDLLKKFNRWPTWMWSNWEIAALTEWLKNHNLHLEDQHKAGFYGLDVYSLYESLDNILKYLSTEDPETAEYVKSAIQCFEPFHGDDHKHPGNISEICKEKVKALLLQIKAKLPNYNKDREAPFNAEQNAYVALNAERYYSEMLSFGSSSWNIRDIHMADTLERLMKFHGKNAKAIIWEHNTHIGDARATDMKDDGLLNIGQILREKHQSDGVILVGLGSYKGTVIAGSKWGAPMKVMDVPEAREDSIEAMLHNESPTNRLIISEKQKGVYRKSNPHRAIGVVYNPEREHWGNYVPSIMAERYDAFLFFDETKALHPLYTAPNKYEMPETYPFGL